MDPRTGKIYELGEDVSPSSLGEGLSREELAAKLVLADREPSKEEALALAEASTLVRVSEKAAQVSRLGHRELARRKRRKRKVKGIVGSGGRKK